ncbi:hypothetical protein E4U36_007603 [Claviceps purpurea]|nr:hypothetical protein E4U36_007603 [Claviceps purpurea]
MSAAEFLRSTRESLVLVFWKPGSTKQRRLDIFAVPSAWNVARPLVVPLVHSVAPRRPLVVSIAQTSIATPLAPPPSHSSSAARPGITSGEAGPVPSVGLSGCFGHQVSTLTLSV